jgi:hypothetical protein
VLLLLIRSHLWFQAALVAAQGRWLTAHRSGSHTSAADGSSHAHTIRRRDAGQATAEYALVMLGPP